MLYNIKTENHISGAPCAYSKYLTNENTLFCECTCVSDASEASQTFPAVRVAGHTLVLLVGRCWCLGWLSLPSATQNSSKQKPEQESNPRGKSFFAAGF